MKVGDLVKIKHDTAFWLGYGVVVEIYAGGKQAKVMWLDNFDEDPLVIEQTSALEVMSEGI
tara:strand:+ start:662 stop:844 length:183 start_codon:yes stop_codon:yes gene_type:complete